VIIPHERELYFEFLDSPLARFFTENSNVMKNQVFLGSLILVEKKEYCILGLFYLVWTFKR
jgi:hypothetical protein